MKDTVGEAMHRQQNTQSLCKLCLLLFLQSAWMVTSFLEDVYPQPTWTYELRISEIYFLSCWFCKTIKLRHESQNPLLNNQGIVHSQKKVGVGCCIYQFSLLSFSFTHHLFVIAWQRTVLGPAGCLVSKARPKISSR